MTVNIPQQLSDISGYPQLKKTDRRVIAAAVLMSLSNQEAFGLFHPEFIDGSGKLNDSGKKASSQFWNYGKVRDYREAYEKEIDDFFGKTAKKKVATDKIDDEKIDKALKKLLNHAIALLDDGENLDPDSVKTIVEVFKKMNLLKEEAEQEIRPLRYLPERCFQRCRYRLFVETAVKKGEIINECDYCRAFRYAKEQGFSGDSTNILDLPKEVLEAEPENTVSTLDILAGKVDN